MSKIITPYITAQALHSQGLNSRGIKQKADSSEIIKIKRGLYRNAKFEELGNQSFADLAMAVPYGVVCLLSALSYHELTTFLPSFVYLAIPNNARAPKIHYPPLKYYYFSPEQYSAGIETIKIGNYPVKIYCQEKTICDCFRYRNKVGLDMAKEGLKEYMKLKNRDINKMLHYAGICRVKPLIETWLNAIV